MFCRHHHLPPTGFPCWCLAENAGSSSGPVNQMVRRSPQMWHGGIDWSFDSRQLECWFVGRGRITTLHEPAWALAKRRLSIGWCRQYYIIQEKMLKLLIPQRLNDACVEDAPARFQLAVGVASKVCQHGVVLHRHAITNSSRKPNRAAQKLPVSAFTSTTLSIVNHRHLVHQFIIQNNTTYGYIIICNKESSIDPVLALNSYQRTYRVLFWYICFLDTPAWLIKSSTWLYNRMVGVLLYLHFPLCPHYVITKVVNNWNQ